MLQTRSYGQLLRRVSAFLPSGRPLGSRAFDKRHRGLLLLLWLHVPALTAFGLIRGFSLPHSAADGAIVAVFATAASIASGQRSKAVAVALGLVVSSSVLVHLWDGRIEGHFHFFVMMTVIALYQSWLPFLAALGFIVVEHGVVGAVAASSVYDHASGSEQPWTWAVIHGAFVLASCIGNLLAWRLIEEVALHDTLTGLPNRALFLDCLEARLAARPERTAVLFLDLDDFKTTNDGFGHAVGDGLLVAVAQRLSARLRTGDLLARLGGDEFAVVLTAPNEASAYGTAERMLAAFSEPFHIGDIRVITGASVGLATAGPQSEPASVLRDADLAMYASKRAGGGRCTVATPDMHDDALLRSALINELPNALGNGELKVYYQPLYTLSDGATVGVEALLRWQHPTRGLLPPVQFMQAAEQSGFIVGLGEHVLRAACTQAVEWRQMFPHHAGLVVCVNFSACQVAEADLVATVAGVLAQTGLAPEQLCLEITETVLVRDLDEVVSKLRALSAMGVRLALDDFGAGYSSLAYLQHMPVHIVKIDRSFIQALGHSPHGTAIVRSVIELAHQLGLAVAAEGIETEQQQEILTSLNCEMGQGYLRARPAPAEVVTSLLRKEYSRPHVSAPTEPSHPGQTQVTGGDAPSIPDARAPGALRDCRRTSVRRAPPRGTGQHHDVVVYDDGAGLINTVTRYVVDGLTAGDHIVIIATEEHRAALSGALTAQGLDVPQAVAAGAYRVLDAAQTLSTFYTAGRLDRGLFTAIIGGAIELAGSTGRPVRAFGEMVALLWADGDAAGAIELEDLWNGLAEELTFTLLCGYPTAALDEHTDLAAVNDVCRVHSHLAVPRSYSDGPEAPRLDARGASRVFIADPAAVPAARRWVQASLREWDERVASDVTLMTSELASKAVTQARSSFRVSLIRSTTGLRMEFEDLTSVAPLLQPPHVVTTRDHGIALVENRAVTHGHWRTTAGKVVWADFPASAA